MAAYGKASNELFTQFLARIALEIPTATVAVFSKLKYVNSPTMELFRANWNAQYLGGFVVHSKAFDGLTGDFPIGFLIWKTNQNSKRKFKVPKLTTEILNKSAQPSGEKSFYSLPNSALLSTWVKRPPSNSTEVVPLKNAVTPATTTKDLRGRLWADGAIAWLNCAGNDLQQANLTFLLSSGCASGRGFFVTAENLWQSSVIFAVRRLIAPTWINDRDQFLQPTLQLSEEFKIDCLIWMLFNGSNLTASANELEWNNRQWSIVNHFIPFTEEAVSASGRFESDFMARHLDKKKLSPQSKTVLDAAQILWREYFCTTDSYSVRDELKLNRPDVGWYQIRNALTKRNESGDYSEISFDAFHSAYKALSEKLRPQVYELGFLRI